MSRGSQLENDYYQEMLTIGPFGGIDPTTSPYSVAPTNFPVLSNLIPNAQYGGYATVPGRIAALAGLLPSAPTGIGKMQRAGQPDLYLFAVTNAGHGAIYAASIGGVPFALDLPAPLTPGKLTYFVPSRKWLFVSNGVDTPIKIDTDLNVTYWGIAAPTQAPTCANAGVGPLQGRYYYCETFSNADQESGQGEISTPFDVTGTAASGTLTFGGAATAGDTLTAVIEGIPVAWEVTAGQDLTHAITALAGQINVNPSIASLFSARVNGNDIIVTALYAGSSGNEFTLYGLVSAGATETVAPIVPTNFAGGTDGGSVRVTPTAVTVDPQVTTRNLYRIGGANGQWALVHSQPVADMTPFLDTIADDEITGQVLTIFRDPPPAFTAIAEYQDRIFGFGTPTDPTAVWWSNYNEPWAFNGAAHVLEAGPNNFNDVAVTCGSLGSMLLLLKTRKAFAVVGNTDDTFTVIELFPVGCLSPTSLAIAEGIAIWDARPGIQMFDGSQRLTVSRGQFQQSNIKSLLAAYSSYDRSLGVGFYYDGLFCMSYPSQNATFVLDPETRQWYPLSFALGAVHFDAESDVPVVGANLQTAGQIDQWFADTVNGDLGQEIFAEVESRVSDFGAIHADKQLQYAYVEAPVQKGAFCNVYVTVNPGLDQRVEAQRIDLGNGTPRHRWELPHGLEGQEMQMRVQTAAKAQTLLHKAAVFGKIVSVHKPSSPQDG